MHIVHIHKSGTRQCILAHIRAVFHAAGILFCFIFLFTQFSNDATKLPKRLNHLSTKYQSTSFLLFICHIFLHL